MIWWVVLFAVLPWGNKQPDKNEQGMAHGAPSNPNLKKKLIATSLVSLIILAIVYYIIDTDVLDFRGKAVAYEKSLALPLDNNGGSQ